MSPLHVVLQAPAPQTYWPQVVADGIPQVPAPVQVGAGVKVTPLQVAAPQTTVVDAWVQAPAPLQVPVFPQVVVTGHWPDGAAAPDG